MNLKRWWREMEDELLRNTWIIPAVVFLLVVIMLCFLKIL